MNPAPYIWVIPVGKTHSFPEFWSEENDRKQLPHLPI